MNVDEILNRTLVDGNNAIFLISEQKPDVIEKGL